MIDVAAVNTMLDGSGWTVDVRVDETVGGEVLVVDEPLVDADGAPIIDAETGEQKIGPVHHHVSLSEEPLVVVATRGDELLRFSPGYDVEEMLLALWDHDTEQAIHDAHDAGEHGQPETRTPGCQRCWEQVWARDAEQARHNALYGDRPADVTAWVKERAGE